MTRGAAYEEDDTRRMYLVEHELIGAPELP